jgi:hypothetical protein
MVESCWYQTNAANLWRYLRNRVRNIYDREADLSGILRNMQQSPPETSPRLAAAGSISNLESK